MEEFEHGNGGSCIFDQFTYLISTGMHTSINHSNCSNGVWGKGKKAEAQMWSQFVMDWLAFLY